MSLGAESTVCPLKLLPFQYMGLSQGSGCSTVNIFVALSVLTWVQMSGLHHIMWANMLYGSSKVYPSGSLPLSRVLSPPWLRYQRLLSFINWINLKRRNLDSGKVYLLDQCLRVQYDPVYICIAQKETLFFHLSGYPKLPSLNTIILLIGENVEI